MLQINVFFNLSKNDIIKTIQIIVNINILFEAKLFVEDLKVK